MKPLSTESTSDLFTFYRLDKVQFDTGHKDTRDENPFDAIYY